MAIHEPHPVDPFTHRLDHITHQLRQLTHQQFTHRSDLAPLADELDRLRRDLTGYTPPSPPPAEGRGRGKCGTNAGYHRHWRAGDAPCEACKAAHAAATARRTRKEQ